MCVAVPGIELSVTVSHSVRLAVSYGSDSLSPSVVRGTGNCDFTLQCVKHSCQSLVR